jgi:hypothetical protein
MPRQPRTPAPEPDLGRVSTVAGEFAVTPRLLRDWIYEGRIAGYKFGPTMIMVDRNDVRAQLRRVPAKSADDAATG